VIFSTQIIVDADQRSDGVWEIDLRYDAEDRIIGFEVGDFKDMEKDELAQLKRDIGHIIITSVQEEKERQQSS
jgi:hypothetical protein